MHSIKGKLIIITVSIVLVGILTIGLLSYYFAERTLKESARSNMYSLSSELLDQRFIEATCIREQRELRFRKNAPCMVEDFKKVAPQQCLAAREENVVHAVRRTLVEDCPPARRIQLGLRERRVFVPHAITIWTTEVALRRQLQRHVPRIAH